MSELLAHIRDIVKKDGPMTVARYMELALQHPAFGYYRHGDPLGAGGDFITAPEISQMFGEMIGLWCADVWRQMGSPEKFILLELGPGRGTLMQDALRATARIHGFHRAMDLCFMESNATLRKMQEEKFNEHLPFFIENLAELPDAPLLVLANEFFDALPIRQFEKTFLGWCERLITVEGDKLAFTPWPLDAAFLLLIPQHLREAPPGTIHEASLASLSLMRDLAQTLVRRGGAGLFLDYGYMEPPGRPTLQAIAHHTSIDVLDQPGEADLTAHVDFASLRTVASTQGAKVMGPLGQGEFLETLGIDLRAIQLKQRSTPAQAKDIDESLHRLIDPSQMGSLFKAMAITAPQLLEIPGF